MKCEPMQRRSFLTLLGGVAAAWPLAARAQQNGRVRRVGVLMGYTEPDLEGRGRFQAFRQGLVELGWLEGRNLRLDVRWAGVDVARLRGYARELVELAPEVLLGATTPATQALQAATQTIPIVFVGATDPVATGIVASLARPEANLTGFMNFEFSLAGKWLSLLRDMAPRVARVALLFNPDRGYAAGYMRAAQDAGERLGLTIAAAGVRDAVDIEPAIAAAASAGEGGLLVLPEPFSLHELNRTTIIAHAAKYRVPAIYFDRVFVANRGLMSYGADLRLSYRLGATYADRILRGAKPADLPVQFATKFNLAINMETAKALGLNVSQQLQFLADEVIE
jgi:putative ABC transport system substrate-binding protein